MRIWYFLLVALVALSVTEARPNFYEQIIDDDPPPEKKCGYESCPKPIPGMLNVHLVAHSHDDVGWLKTVDQYYYGSGSTIQKAGVQFILDSVVVELLKDPIKRFIYVETAYLWKWWNKQTDSRKEEVKMLINEGRLEIIGGSWSMNDEAVTHYQSIVDQFTWGLRKISDTFGECGLPRVGWQIDPFGHSREMASMFAQMGYDGLFFGRMDYQDKIKRKNDKTMEMLWQGSANIGKNSQLFTGVLNNSYHAPDGFCFDILCDDEPIIDDESSPYYNVNERVAAFKFYAEQQASYYATDHILMTMGQDFAYMDAYIYFHNTDKLIKYTNALQSTGSKVNLIYSTPSCYLKALHDEDKSWTEKSDDFFPHASDAHTYWTGYYTSRPTLKQFERIGNNMLQVCKQLSSIDAVNSEELDNLREAMGIMQHHDAITGTEKQHVAADYARILNKAIDGCEDIVRTSLNELMTAKKEIVTLELNSCLLLNISECRGTESGTNFIVTLYNPLAYPVDQNVRLPVDASSKFSVLDPQGTVVPSQLVPIPEQIITIPGRSSSAMLELVFRAKQIPPLGYKSFYVERTDSAKLTDSLFVDLKDPKYREVKSFEIGSENVKISIDLSTGQLEYAKWNGFQIDLTQDFQYYVGAVGDNKEPDHRSSGAYIFRPNGTEIQVAPIQTDILVGRVVDEVHQVFNKWVSQVVRVYKEDNHIEFDWQVGPIPDNDDRGKEVISRFSTNIDNKGVFYTDSNGRELLKRVRNERPTWNVDVAEPVAGNYYPITTKIQIKSSEASLSILTDRAQGGSSVYDGSLELMVHRRLFHDDAFGVVEPINEMAYGTGLIARGQHYIIGGKLPDTSSPTRDAEERILALKKLLPAWTFISDASKITVAEWKDQYRNEFSGLTAALPKNVHIMTLEPWRESELLLRLEHILEQNEDPSLSEPATVDIEKLFTAFTVTSARETTLAGNQWLSEAKRLNWKSSANPSKDDGQKTYRMGDQREELEGFKVTLKPMEIRTFVIKISK